MLPCRKNTSYGAEDVVMLGIVLRLFIDKLISLIASSAFFVLQSEDGAIREKKSEEVPR